MHQGIPTTFDTTSNPVGTGPMEFVKWLRDDQITLKKAKNYWDKGADGQPLPYLDGYTERVILDSAVAVVELKAGTVQFTRDVDGKDIATVKATPNLIYDQQSFSENYHFVSGLSKLGAFGKDVKLRQAALYGVDREALAKTFGFGVGKAHYYPYWGPNTLGYNEKNPRYDCQPEKAKQLLKESGAGDGLDISMYLIAREPDRRVGEAVQAMWNQIGIRTKLEAVDRLAYLQKEGNQQYDAAFKRIVEMADPDMVSTYLSLNGPNAIVQHGINDLDQCIKDGNAEYDRAKRVEVYTRCQKIVYENAYWSVGFSIPLNYVYTSSLKGVKYNWTFADLREAWLDK